MVDFPREILPKRSAKTIGTFTYALPACPYRNRRSESIIARRDGRQHRLGNRDAVYSALKIIHVSFAILSIAGFILRGVWMFGHSANLHRRIVRVAPHVVDTAFLISGIWLVVILHLVLREQAWLIAKLTALNQGCSICRSAIGIFIYSRCRSRQIADELDSSLRKLIYELFARPEGDLRSCQKIREAAAVAGHFPILVARRL